MDEKQGGGGDRHETEDERFDRNWDEQLQELRVSQTGVQLLGGFLLTLPFQERFSQLDRFQVTVYLGLIVLAALTTGLTLTPIAVHRTLFREGRKREIVEVAHRVTRAILGAVATLMTGIVFLVVDVVVDRTVSSVVAGCLALVLFGLLLVMPRFVRGQDRRSESAA